MKYSAAIALLSAASAGWIGFEPATPPEDVATAMMRNGMNSTSHQDPVWVAYEMLDLEEKREASGRPWLPFLDVSTLNAGLYVLPAGGTDSQQPHRTDEVYYVLSGRRRTGGRGRGVRGAVGQRHLRKGSRSTPLSQHNGGAESPGLLL